jgi:hypothetical protein
MTPLKILIGLVLLLTLIFGVALYTNRTLARSADKMEKHITSIEKNVRSKKWDKVRLEMSTVQKTWSGTEKVWTLLLDHIEIDNIGNSLAKMTNYIKAKDKNLTLGETASLRKFIRHIPDKEGFKLKNIF